MERFEIKISPRMLCPCGKSCKPLTEEERKSYDEIVQQIAEARLKRGEVKYEKNRNQP